MLRKSVRLQDVRRLLKQAQALELSPHAVMRLKWYAYAYACEHGRNISLTCRHFGIARSTFLRWSDRFDANDLSTLEEKSRRPHHVREPETDEGVVEKIRQLRSENPTTGKVGIQKMLAEKFGVHVSTSTVGRIIQRHNLFFGDSDSHQEKRHAMHDQEHEHPSAFAVPSAETVKKDVAGDDGAFSLVPHPSA